MILFLWLKKKEKTIKKTKKKKKNLLQNRADKDELGLSPWLLPLQSQKTTSLLYNMHMLRIYHTNMKYYVLFRGEEIQNLWIINREPLALEPSLTPKSWLILKAFCRVLRSLDHDGIKYNSRCNYIFGVVTSLSFCHLPTFQNSPVVTSNSSKKKSVYI